MPEQDLKRTESELETEMIRAKIKHCAQVRCDQMKRDDMMPKLAGKL